MARHKQVRIMSENRQMFALVDEGMAETISRLWEMGVHTFYSCESDIFDKAYVLMPYRSARRLEKLIRDGLKRGIYTPEALDAIECFVEGSIQYEFSLFRTRKTDGKTKIRTIWQWDHRFNWGQPYVVERLFSNAFGRRATYRWPSSATPAVLKVLIETSQKLHGL